MREKKSAMDKELEELRTTVQKVLRDHCPPELVESSEGSWAPDLWGRFGELGLIRAGVSEDVGGYGGGDAVAAEVVRAAAGGAAPIPLAETTMVAGWVRAQVGLEHIDQPATVITALDSGVDLTCERGASGLVVSGTARAVPWAHASANILLVIEKPGCVVSLTPADLRVERGVNLAGEPRDQVEIRDLALSGAVLAEVPDASALAEGVRLRTALSRSVMMAGALDAVLGLALQYTGERVQFGRPIAQFQAVRQSLSVLAGHASAALIAADAAVQHADDPGAVVPARVLTAKAASDGARIAHQLFGTIGFTREHRLQQFTRRLWAWRDEGGTERYWTQRYGESLARGRDGSQVWSAIVGSP